MHQLYGYPYLIISYISIDNNLNEILRLFFKSKKKKNQLDPMRGNTGLYSMSSLVGNISTCWLNFLNSGSRSL